MSIESIIEHMNKHHKENLIDLVKKFGAEAEVVDAKLVSVDFDGLDIKYNNEKKLRIEFTKKATNETLKDIIIELCQSVKQTYDFVKVKDELDSFMKSCGSICLATLSSDGEVMCSYAPIIQTSWGNYIYISEVSEHFSNIKNNPNNIEIMYLEDESKAASVILRKRARFRSVANFIERGNEFDKTFDEFEKIGGGGIKTIRKMLDFHLIKLDFVSGRFVKGFGQAYDIKNGKISFAGSSGNPHKFPSK